MAEHHVDLVRDRIKETTTSTGSGSPITLAGAADGFQSFAAIGDGKKTYYAIESGGSDAWEVGIGQYTASGTTLSRDTILESSNSGAAITLSGTSTVFCTYPAEESIHGLGSGGTMVQTSAETWSTGALSVVSFDSSSSWPGQAATGGAVELDTTNNRIRLLQKGWYQITGMCSAENDDAYGESSFWLTLNTGTAVGDAFTVSYHENPGSDVTYGVITAPYYCATPTDDIYFGIWPSGSGGVSSYTASVSTDRYKPKLSAVFVR